MKRYAAFLLAIILALTLSIPVSAVDNPAFSVRIAGTLDAEISYNGKNTFVLDWQLMANRPDMTLKNLQAICLAYDNTVLQLARWDATSLIADATVVVEDLASSISGVGNASGNYKDFDGNNVPIRAYVAKSKDGNRGFLSLNMGSDMGDTLWKQGVYTSLGRVRFSFREGKTKDDLTSDSVRLMTVAEMNLLYQRYGTLNIASEKGGVETMYLYRDQIGGTLRDNGNIDPPIMEYPGSDQNKDGTPPGGTPDTPGGTPGTPGGTPDTPGGAPGTPGGAPGTPGGAPDTPGGASGAPGGTPGAPGGTPGTSDDGKSDPDIPIFNTPDSSFANPYSDVKEGDWYYPAVRFATEKGLMNGTGNNAFSPGNPMTRAMFATVLYRMALDSGLLSVTGNQNMSESVADNAQSSNLDSKFFVDVVDGAWYSEAVKWAAANGIVFGYDDSHFGPGDSVTREQIVTILCRYAGKLGRDTSGQADLSQFTDRSQISSWALPAMSWAVYNHIISGRSVDTLAPSSNMTRAEVAQILLNFNNA